MAKKNKSKEIMDQLDKFTDNFSKTVGKTDFSKWPKAVEIDKNAPEAYKKMIRDNGLEVIEIDFEEKLRIEAEKKKIIDEFLSLANRSFDGSINTKSKSFKTKTARLKYFSDFKNIKIIFDFIEENWDNPNIIGDNHKVSLHNALCEFIKELNFKNPDKIKDIYFS